MRQDRRNLMARRSVIAGTAAALTLMRIPLARAVEDDQAGRILAEIMGGRAPIEGEALAIDLPPVAENGSQVPLTVRVESPMTADDHVTTIHVISTRNPAPDIGTFRLTPALARAEVFTRIRLAEAQKIFVVAEMSDGRVLQAAADVVVSVGGCAT
ncbi:MAG: thiosulfate oxidation carrier protein SoxY [Rubrimonas sp.]